MALLKKKMSLQESMQGVAMISSRVTVISMMKLTEFQTAFPARVSTIVIIRVTSTSSPIKLIVRKLHPNLTFSKTRRASLSNKKILLKWYQIHPVTILAPSIQTLAIKSQNIPDKCLHQLLNGGGKLKGRTLYRKASI